MYHPIFICIYAEAGGLYAHHRHKPALGQIFSFGYMAGIFFSLGTAYNILLLEVFSQAHDQEAPIGAAAKLEFSVTLGYFNQIQKHHAIER